MDIYKHILDHAREVYCGLSKEHYENKIKVVQGKDGTTKIEETDKTHHFNFSVDRAQLIAAGYVTKEQQDEVMRAFKKDLEQYQYNYVESKGAGKTRQRSMDFSKSLIAYHDSGFSNKTNAPEEFAPGQNWTSDEIGAGDTEPHFHIRLPNEDRDRGKDFVNVRNGIAVVAQKYGFAFNFMEENEKAITRDKPAELKRASWAWKKADNLDIKKWVLEQDKLIEKLELLYKDAQKTGNLQYYVKTMNSLRDRLKSQDLHLEWRGHDITKTYPLTVSNNDIKTLEILKSGSIKEIEVVVADRNNKIGRAYLEHLAGYQNHIITELTERGFEFQKVSLDQLDLTNAQKPKIKKYFTHDRSTIEAQKESREYYQREREAKFSTREALKNDFLDVVSQARSEAELKDLLLAKGYSSVGFSTKQAHKVGLKMEWEGKKYTLKFAEFESEWPVFRNQLFENSQNIENIDLTRTSSEMLKVTTADKTYDKNDFCNVDLYSADETQDLLLRQQALEKRQELFNLQSELKSAKDDFIAEALKDRARTVDTTETRKQIRETALKMLTEGNQAIFLSGEGGSGKSHTTRQAIEMLEKQGKSIAKLGSTGIASCNIGGQTLHSFFGIGVASTKEELKQHREKNPKAKEAALARLKDTDVIIIDEISMVHAKQMDLMKHIIEESKWQGKLIFVGDFNQIPPVHKGEEHEPKFAFESQYWKELNVQNVNLFGNMRVKVDPNNPELAKEAAEFTEVLNRVRYGDTSDYILDYLEKLQNNEVDEQDATHIFATNKEVKEHNKMILESVEGDEISIKNKLEIDGLKKLSKEEIDEIYNNVTIDETLELKLGAKIMVLNNDQKNDVYNGDRAEVLKVTKDEITIKLERNNAIKTIKKKEYEVEHTDKKGKVHNGKVTGFPVRLSYGITAHKSQGLSLKNVVAYSKNIFENAQFYVALSRATDPKSIKIVSESREELARAIKADTKALSYMHNALDHSKVDQATQKLREHKKQTEQSTGLKAAEIKEIKSKPIKEIKQNERNIRTKLRSVFDRASAIARTVSNTVKNINRAIQSATANDTSVGAAKRTVKNTLTSTRDDRRITNSAVAETVAQRLVNLQFAKDGAIGIDRQVDANIIATTRGVDGRSREGSVFEHSTPSLESRLANFAAERARDQELIFGKPKMPSKELIEKFKANIKEIKASQKTEQQNVRNY